MTSLAKSGENITRHSTHPGNPGRVHLRALLEESATAVGDGFDVASPRAALRRAYRQGWIDDEEAWLRTLDDRNLTSRSYREPLALEIYRRIPDHHRLMSAAYAALRERAS
jgi:nucleotidyltransferase substrate binding protein (TIGR01987 family)